MLTLLATLLYGLVLVVGLVGAKTPTGGYLTGNILRWRKDARVFARECIGVTPDRWQDEALRLVSDPRTRRLAFKACKGPGKTAVLAWIVLWFLTTHPNSNVACTSITEANINSGLWKELFKWMDGSPFLKAMFKWTKVRVARRGAAGANWYAEKRTWPKTGSSEEQSNALAGFHADDVMFVLDESGGIPQSVMVTAEAVLANLTEEALAAGHRAIVVQAGNPTHTTGPLYRACTAEARLWHVITITGDPDDPMRSPRISIEHAKEQIELWGRDNPWVMVNILGQFPPASINALLGVEEVEAAMKRHYRRDQYEMGQKRLGVDVARFGDDRTVIFPRQGIVAFKPDVLRTQRTTTIAARVARANKMWEPEFIFVDDSGHWGHGVIDGLIAMSIPCIAVMYGERSPDRLYGTVRDQMYMELAKWVKAGGALPNIPGLKDELTAFTYTFMGNRFVVEDKKMIKAKIGVSPDLSDALAETFYLPEMPGRMLETLRDARRARSEFNPMNPEELQADLEDTVDRLRSEWDPFAEVRS